MPNRVTGPLARHLQRPNVSKITCVGSACKLPTSRYLFVLVVDQLTLLLGLVHCLIEGVAIDNHALHHPRNNEVRLEVRVGGVEHVRIGRGSTVLRQVGETAMNLIFPNVELKLVLQHWAINGNVVVLGGEFGIGQMPN